MSFTIQAPYPGLQTTSVLPNPQLSDGEAVLDSVTPKRAMDGTLYTYVKRKGGRRKLTWTFAMTRNKALELRAFVRSYFASKIRITDHSDRVWIGNFTNDPFEFTGDRRAWPALQNMTAGEITTIQLEFEGVEQ